MAKNVISISMSKCLRDLSNSELKIYLHILERVNHPFPFKFEVNLMDLCRDCNISIPTAKSALNRLVNKGNLLFLGRTYKTAPGEYSLPSKEQNPQTHEKPKTPQEIARSVGLSKVNLDPKAAYVRDIVYHHSLTLIKAEHLSLAKEVYQRPLSQEDLKDFYMKHVWKNRDDDFTVADTLKFLSDIQSGVPISDVIKRYLDR